ncbi:MAG TPA: S-methyl-5'-thioadenosine phosphorylase, partial [Candidatus Omnitrophota bacterium]|nr:S-methyl-5'-thioadenosine phosphorylase [Candidatus Omnitrophota bacterium]
HQTHETVSVEMIIATLRKNVANAQALLKAAVPRIGALENFSAREALKYALITSPEAVPAKKKKELSVLIGKYLPV